MKHIAPYLPYNVQIQVTDTCVDMYTYETKEETYITTLDTRRLDYFKEDMKLVLRPLSDLTKEIEHNGENFIPLYKLISEDRTFTTSFIYTFGYEELKVSVYELLLKWHFDIFVLIESGQAIDINTLNK